MSLRDIYLRIISISIFGPSFSLVSPILSENDRILWLRINSISFVVSERRSGFFFIFVWLSIWNILSSMKWLFLPNIQLNQWMNNGKSISEVGISNNSSEFRESFQDKFLPIKSTISKSLTSISSFSIRLTDYIIPWEDWSKWISISGVSIF